MKGQTCDTTDPDNQTDFQLLKKRIYTMYVMIAKAHFMGAECEVSESNFDMLVAEVCVSQLNGTITQDEFKNLSSYLINAYKVFKLERK